MGLFDLFKKITSTKNTTPNKMSNNIRIDKWNDFLDIDSPDFSFYGPYSTSANGRYTLGWSDFNDEVGLGGHRSKGMGSYVLLMDDRLILKGELERPNDGLVANNGSFVINDWMFANQLGGTFYAFNLNGEIIIKKKFNANPYNNGISKNGKYAVCQTCNSKDDDGNLLSFFNLESGKMIWTTNPEPGWADHYRFENDTLYLHFNNGNYYRYSFEGQFLDEEKLRNAEVERPDLSNGYSLEEEGYALISKLETSTDMLNIKDYQRAFELLEAALKSNITTYRRSLIHRKIGEVYLKFEHKNIALEHFNKAIALNPKVGLKRLISALEKETSQKLG